MNKLEYRLRPDDMINPEEFKLSTFGHVMSPKEIVEDKLCQNCKKEKSLEEHICPYMSDVNDDKTTLCNCCENCMGNCTDDI